MFVNPQTSQDWVTVTADLRFLVSVGSETEKSLHAMPLQHQSNGNTSPYSSPPHRELMLLGNLILNGYISVFRWGDAGLSDIWTRHRSVSDPDYGGAGGEVSVR